MSVYINKDSISIGGVTITFKPGLSFLGKETIKHNYISDKGKTKSVTFYSPTRYHLYFKGSAHKYFSDEKYSNAVNAAATICKYKWDTEFYNPESKINKIA